jgi:hypothetical protein
VTLQILHVPGCPGVALLTERLAEVMPGRAAELEIVVVSEQTDAERLGMCGSPTLLVDGADPFADRAQSPSLSCRLFPGPNGTMTNAPSVDALRAALLRD